jgi:hypothetical protein
MRSAARPGLAYAWLRGRDSLACQGYTADRFRRELLPVVQAHAADASHAAHDDATHFLAEGVPDPARAPLELVLAWPITAATTVADFEALLGPAARDIGSGIHILVFPLRGGEELRVGSPDRTAIQYVHVAADQRPDRVLYPRKGR